ncbi:morphogenic membrane protein MmpA [Streptomyces sp. NPDC002784]
MTSQRGASRRTASRRSPKPLADPERPVERAVTAVLVLAVLAGLGWICGMIYTVAQWPL